MEKKESLKKASKLKDQIVTLVSHALCAPLGAILLHSRYMVTRRSV
ncbi:MAG: hypothetical protein OEZ32_13570 [Nitrospinota bacterium]|nr:hypothetical protein [Nitrospinota bacterium]